MISSPYRKILLDVEKPGRYVGGEFGSVENTDSAQLRVALGFPDAYEVGTSHVGLSILYEIVNRHSEFRAERVFMPWPDMARRLMADDLPLVSLESHTPLREFDIVGFSLQYELCFTNVVSMLKMGGIAVRSADREENAPLVIVGGPVAAQAEPIAPFVDLVLLGDGESSLITFMSALAAAKKKGHSRDALVRELSRLSFAYAPGLLEREMAVDSGRLVSRHGKLASGAVEPDLGDLPTGNGPVAAVQAVFDRYSVEIARGCTQGCRFCQAGFMYRPVRERGTEQVDGALNKAVRCLGYDEVSLLALSSADHSQINALVTQLGAAYMRERVSFSVPSLRAYGLSEQMISVLSTMRATGVTLAPEAGTQRLRDVINKNVTEDDIMGAAGRFFSQGYGRIKLYFMLGLPTETDDDLMAIVDLAARIRNMGKTRTRRKVDVIASVSTFVPKPFTPFEREPMLAPAEILRRQKIIKDAARHHRIVVKTHDVNLSVLEGIFARGDARLADLIETAANRGACFDGWDEWYDHELWGSLLETIDVSTYLGTIQDTAPVPWDVVDSPVTPEFRKAERDRAYTATSTPPCGVFLSDGDPHFVCHACGVTCDPERLPKKPPRRLEVSAGALPATGPSVQVSRPTPRAVVQAGTDPMRYGATVAFWGRQSYLGHLDRMRHILRSLQRANVPLWYTEGFHPKPKIESPPPLPLGVGGIAEPFDFHVAAPLPDDIVTRLNRAVPADLRFVTVSPLSVETPRLSARYTAAMYLVLVNRPRPDVVKAVETLVTSTEMEVVRHRKGRTRVVEIRQFLHSARVLDTCESPFLPPAGDRVPVEMIIAIPGSGGTRPQELMTQVLEGVAGDDLWVLRTKWLP